MTQIDEKKYFNEDGLVLCQYCLKPFKVITKNHLTFHNLTLDDYKQRYPDAPMKWKGFNYNLKKDTPRVVTDVEYKVEWDTSSPLTKENAYLILKQRYPKLQKNYIYKKYNKEGQILFTFMVDFGEPNAKILIDFENMTWHARTPLFTKWRKIEIAGMYKWKYVNFDKEFENMEEFLNLIKNTKLFNRKK